jgi:circadian clock protein KaiC
VSEQAALDDDRLTSGVAGLDDVLYGGFIPRRSYMVRGEPGVGKTALGLHFLAAGAAGGDTVLFLSQGATEEALRQDAASIGIATDGIDFLDFTPAPEVFTDRRAYDIFTTPDVGAESWADEVIRYVDERRPSRVFLDALTQGRHLATDIVDFRRQAHAFLRYLVDRGATVLFASGSSDPRTDEDLQFLSDGVLHIEYSRAAGGRILTVTKLRGSRFRLGHHSIRIEGDGVHVYPRLMPETHGRDFSPDQIRSGVPEIDALVGGGIERGTVTLITGPTGIGKTTLALTFAKAAAERGERSVVYSFEETVDSVCHRSRAVGIPVQEMVDAGDLAVIAAEPLDYTPEQFALAVRHEIEERGARLIVLDSLAGYKLAVRGDELSAHIHALCNYLKNMGATVILIWEMTSITGEFQATDAGLSYLADNIVFLRYMELDGELRRVIGVLKKRLSDFEKRLRELQITSEGVKVGEPLSGMRGILRGVPEREPQRG